MTLISASVLAEVKFANKRDFKIVSSCNATRSIKKQTNPTPVKPGDIFSAFSINKAPNTTHVRIRIRGVLKWVKLICGQFVHGNESFLGNVERIDGSKACLPFFDKSNDTVTISSGDRVDITPDFSRSDLDDFDKAVQKICGKAGKVVSESEFKLLMRSNMNVLKRVHVFTGGKVFANRPKPADMESYLNDLTDAWFSVKAFDHIYCGEPKAKGGIGGLHFHGRYLQLQETNEACRLNNFGHNEAVENVIYTIGVRMKNANGRFVTKPKSGYGLTLSAEDLLKAITLAFLQNPIQSFSNRQACLLDIKDDGQVFKAVFVRRAAGIRTFFPDASPKGSACKSKINLQ